MRETTSLLDMLQQHWVLASVVLGLFLLLILFLGLFVRANRKLRKVQQQAHRGSRSPTAANEKQTALGTAPKTDSDTDTQAVADSEDAPHATLDAAIIRPALGKEMMEEIEAVLQTKDLKSAHSLALRIEDAGNELSSDELAAVGTQLANAVAAQDQAQIQKLLRFLSQS